MPEMGNSFAIVGSFADDAGQRLWRRTDGCRSAVRIRNNFALKEFQVHITPVKSMVIGFASDAPRRSVRYGYMTT
jgi:hypothetical protein